MSERTQTLCAQDNRTFLDLSFDVILIVDSTGRIVDANESACNVLRLPRETILKGRLQEFINPNANLELTTAFESLQATGMFLGELPLLVEKRITVPIEWGVKLDSGKEFAVWTGRDMTGRNLLKEKLQAEVRLKELLIKEAYHRVKNHLQILVSIINLEASAFTLSAGDFSRKVQDRIRAMAMIHDDILGSNDSFENVDLRSYLQRLATNLYSCYGRKEQHVQLTLDCEPLSIDLNRAVHVGLIVNEILSNAFKYAFPKRRKGEVSLRLQKKDNFAVLELADNGVGLPADTHQETKKTFGLILIDLLVKQLDGSFLIDRKCGMRHLIQFQI